MLAPISLPARSYAHSVVLPKAKQAHLELVCCIDRLDGYLEVGRSDYNC